MITTPSTSGPAVDAAGVTFRLPDAHARLRGVRLQQEVRVPSELLDFRYRRGAWTLRLARPDVDRMEYLFELTHRNEGRETMLDPGNPLRAPGAFGEKSVIEFPDYRRPGWLDQPAVPGVMSEVAVPSRNLGSTLRGRIWAAESLSDGEPAPLLIAHDGPEYDELAGLLHYIGTLVAAGRVAPMRVVLLAPGDRNRWYAVSPAYARALGDELLPALAEAAPSTVRIGAGASLGALAMLHAHRSCPGMFDGLLLQSGSFFLADADAHERRFSRFGPVTKFVRDVAQAVADAHPVPVAMTCGRPEENLENNRVMAAALARLAYPVQLHEVADVHNYTAWRDAFDPWLGQLIEQVTGAEGDKP